MKDHNCNAYEEGATFQQFTYEQLSMFLKRHMNTIWNSANRFKDQRGVVKSGHEYFFVRKKGSLEAFPRISARVVQCKVYGCEVKMINTNRIGTLRKVGSIYEDDYISAAAMRVMALSRKSPKPKKATVVSALHDRWNEKQKKTCKLSCKMPYTIGDQKFMIGKSVQQLEDDIAAYKVKLTANGKIPRGIKKNRV